jgi:hypothetical protein
VLHVLPISYSYKVGRAHITQFPFLGRVIAQAIRHRRASLRLFSSGSTKWHWVECPFVLRAPSHGGHNSWVPYLVTRLSWNTLNLSHIDPFKTSETTATLDPSTDSDGYTKFLGKQPPPPTHSARIMKWCIRRYSDWLDDQVVQVRFLAEARDKIWDPPSLL